MTTPTHDLTRHINDAFGIELPPANSIEMLKESLAAYLEFLIDKDFNKLVYLLYRVDVDEQKLKDLLSENTANSAGRLMAELIVERQLEKIRTRSQFKPKGENNIDENEKW